MFSKPLLEKWKKLLERKYGVKSATQEEVFEFANTLTGFFDLLLKLDREDRLKNQINENKYGKTKTKN